MRLPRPALLAFGLLCALLSPVLRTAPVAEAASTGRVSFTADKGSSILVHGTYPKTDSPCVDPTIPVLHARYHGTIEIGRDTDGTLFVIGVVPFEQYLEGIAEVPRTWPMDALKAQVVAARTYALSRMSRPDPTGQRLGYQLCATDACQVYRGMGVSDGPYGERWQAAVEQTHGQVLLYGGRPADTLYFSTSNGSTVGNEDVFGTSPLPYLRPVPENDDGASPLSHWHVEMPFADVARFLRSAGAWGGSTISSLKRSGDSIVISGGGASTSISVNDLRLHLNYWAHCLAPSTYPGQLPQTIPSKWFSLTTNHHRMILDGRGWGHGVGMVQWGAEGKAARGMSYSDILAYYYGGLRPKQYDEPKTIRVGIAVGLSSVHVEATGNVTVEGRTLGAGPWRLVGGKRLTVRQTGRIKPVIEPGALVGAPKQVRTGKAFTTTLSLPQPSVARLVIQVHGREVDLSPTRTLDEGTAVVSAAVPKSVPPATYALRAKVTNGIDVVFTDSRRLLVVSGSPSPSPPSPSPPTPPSEPSPTPSVELAHAPSWPRIYVTAVVAVVLLTALVALTSFIRKRRGKTTTGAPQTG